MAEEITEILDGDGHIMERDEEIHPYLDKKYQFEGMRAFPFFPTLDGWVRTAFAAQAPGGGSGGGLSLADATGWLKFLDDHNIQLTVIYPTAALGFGLLKDPVWAADLARGYNDFVYDRFLKKSPRLKAVALLPVQNPQAAAKELHRAVDDLGMVGGLLPATGLRLPFGDPHFDPIYDAAQSTNTMLAMHGAPQQGLGFDFFDSFLPGMVLEHPFSQMIQFTDMMFKKTFDRFPKLKMAFLEAGCGWVPYLIERIDWMVRSKMAEHAVRDHPIYFHAELEEGAVMRTAISEIGDDRFIYASDFPHEPVSEIEEGLEGFLAREDVSVASKKKILCDNIKALYSMN